MFDGLAPRPLVASRLTLDPLDPINRGLVLYVPVVGGAGKTEPDISPYRRLGTTNDTSQGGALARTVRQKFGRVGAFSSSNATAVDFGYPPHLRGLQMPLTITAWVWATSLGSYHTIFSEYVQTFTHQLIKVLRVDGTTLTYYASTDGGNFQSVTGPTITTGEWQFVAVTARNASEIVLVRNNSFTSRTLSSPLSASPVQTIPTIIGADYYNNAYGTFWDGSIAHVREYSRALTATEILRLYREPEAGAFNAAARLFVAMRGGALNHYTLSLDPGAFALSGQAVGLRAARRLALAAGAVALTGQDVALRAGRRLSAEAGGFALTGQDVALRRGYRLDAAAGSFTVSGQSVALRAARRLALDAGSFTLSGQDVGLRAGRRLAAEAGAFAVDGLPVSLLRGYLLAAGVGTFTLSGQAVALIYSGAQALPAGRTRTLRPRWSSTRLVAPGIPTLRGPADPK